MGRESLFNIWFCKNKYSMQWKEARPLTSLTIINLKWLKDWNTRHGSIKVWEENTEYSFLTLILTIIFFQLTLKSPATKLACFSSLQFSRSVVSDSLRPHESHHVRPSCPLPMARIHSDSCISSRWCHPAISSSIVPFSFCPQSLSASESFLTSQLFAWGGQNTGVSALALFLPNNTQGWSPLEWTNWISLRSKGLSGVFSNTSLQKNQFFGAQLSSQSNSHIHTWPQEKP